MPTPVTICGLDELPHHAEAGVSHVLSILDPEYPVPDAFGGYGAHARLELRFHDAIEPAPGIDLPQPDHVAQVLAFGRDVAAEPEARRRLLVHCHAGVSRSTAATLLIHAEANPELGPDALADAILGVREKAWPNLRMIEYGDEQLGRGRVLIAAAARIYAAQLRRRPELAQFMEGAGRAREVALGRGVG